MTRYHCHDCQDVWIDSTVNPIEGMKCPECGAEMEAETKKTPPMKAEKATSLSGQIMAFWHYSGGNKYFCCGKVTQINDEGNVETEEFGRGCFFKPVAFFHVDRGLEIKQALTKLETKHDREYKEMRQRQRKEVKAAIGELLPFKE